MAFFSKVVGREIFLSWQGNNPKVVYLDSLPFTTQEIEALKRRDPSPDDLRAVCQVKEAFDGEVQDR